MQKTTLPRLIDLHTDWLLQYAPETTVFDPSLYGTVARRLSQSEGYLQGTSAAVLSCYRQGEDWARQADPWGALGQLITRIEAEFPGRLLIGPDDFARWRAEPEGLCWAVIGVEGFDFLVRAPADLDRLASLFDRGVRLFQPLYSAANVLGGSSTPGDDRGLTDLGLAFLETLADLGSGAAHPLFDLAHLNPIAAADALGWFEADAERSRRVVPVYSHGALYHDGFAHPRAITADNLRRLRALGGVVGFTPSFYESGAQLQAGIESAAALPFEGRAGYEGIAIGTDFLGVDQTPPDLGTVAEIGEWIGATFSPLDAAALLHTNGLRLLERAVGVAGVPLE